MRIKRLNNILVILGLLNCLIIPALTQPTKPQSSIPSTTMPSVRRQIQRLYSADPAERANGASMLGEMGRKAAPAIPFLVELVNDHKVVKQIPDVTGAFSMEVGEVAARAIGALGGLNILVSLLNSAVGNDRINLIYGLAVVGSPALPYLAPLRTDKDAKIRAIIADALSYCGRLALPYIIDLLKDEKIEVRRKAAKGIGVNFGDRPTFSGMQEAINVLLIALRDSDSQVQRNAYNSLTTISPSWTKTKAWQDLKAEIIKQLLYGQQGEKRAAIRNLWLIQDSSLPIYLIQQLMDESVIVRNGAFSGLCKLGNDAVIPLIAKLTDSNVQMRSRVALALDLIAQTNARIHLYDMERAIDPLFSALNDGNLEVQVNALSALGAITKTCYKPEINYVKKAEADKYKRLLRVLIESLDNKEQQIRITAQKSLENISKKRLGEETDAWLRWMDEEFSHFQLYERRD